MTSTSLETTHGNDDTESALPGVHVKRARSNEIVWLKIRFAVGFSVRSVFSLNGDVVSASKNVWLPS